MTSPPITVPRNALLLAVLAPTAMFVSPAAFSILLGAALLILFWTHIPLRIPPPTRLPLLLFVVGTLIAVALSPHPLACWPQVKKFWVFFTFAVFFSAVRHIADVRRVVLLWAALGSVTAIWSFEQFVRKWEAARTAHADFYLAYIASRVTGLRDHWMTFAGEQMIVVLIVAALLLFGPRVQKRWWLPVALTLIIASLVISLTRGVWIATIVGLLYLVGVWRPRWLPSIPVVLLLLTLAGPTVIRERIVSLYHPRGETDSNLHRVYVWRTGLEMVRAHPGLGFGRIRCKCSSTAICPPIYQSRSPWASMATCITSICSMRRNAACRHCWRCCG